MLSHLLATVLDGLAHAREADPTLLATSAACFAVALAYCGCAWRAGLESCGRTLTPR